MERCMQLFRQRTEDLQTGIERDVPRSPLCLSSASHIHRTSYCPYCQVECGWGTCLSSGKSPKTMAYITRDF